MHNRSKYFKKILSLFSYLLVRINLTLAVGGSYYCYPSNFTSNSTYDNNLSLILSSLASHVTLNNGGFYNTSIGQDPNKVYALALCRGDSPSNEYCVNCVKTASQDIMTACPNKKEAFMWGGGVPECLVRYADHSIYGKLDLPPSTKGYGGNFTEVVKSNLTGFAETWETLMDSLVKKVSMKFSMPKFVTEEANFNTFQTIYALMQCTPDMSKSDCDVCLRRSVDEFEACCLRNVGGNTERANCYFGWSLNPFYSPHIDAPPAWTNPDQTTNTTVNKYQGNGAYKISSKIFRIVIIIVAAAAAVVISIISICILTIRVNKSRRNIGTVKEFRNIESLQFDIDTIRFATDNFSDANKLGQGGFGVVYKGTLPDGQEVAVKRLSRNSMQGDKEFKNEVSLVAGLQHRNLVKLLGFCLDRNERILVYEFLPNSSLDRFIFDPIKHEHLDWKRRYRIIEGIARGLLYLHEDSRLRIIYRDLKASNILLDSEMNPKISDFETARLFDIDKTHSSTDKVVGTFGYMASKYLLHKRFSVKTDVFSFGVLILEIVSGQKRSDFGTEEETGCLLTYAWKRWNEGTALHLIDSSLTEGPRSEMMECIIIGLLCVQENVSDRPTMATVFNMLNSDSITLPIPSKPGIFMQSSVIPEAASSSLEHNSSGSIASHQQKNQEIVPLSQNEASITEPYPL